MPVSESRSAAHHIEPMYSSQLYEYYDMILHTAVEIPGGSPTYYYLLLTRLAEDVPSQSAIHMLRPCGLPLMKLSKHTPQHYPTLQPIVPAYVSFLCLRLSSLTFTQTGPFATTSTSHSPPDSWHA